MKSSRPLETNYNQEEVFSISIDSSYEQKNEATPFSSASDGFDSVVERPLDSNLHKTSGWLGYIDSEVVAFFVSTKPI